MKMSHRVGIAVFAGFVIYTLLIFVWGDSGTIRLSELRSHRDRLAENITDLEEINNELLFERDSLLHDATEVELRARSLGYRRSGEVKITLPTTGRKNGGRTLGAYIRRKETEGRGHLLFRVIGCVIGSVAFAATFIFGKNGKRTR